MAKRLLIKGGRLIDKERGYENSAKDILVEDGVIKDIADFIKTDDAEVLELNGEYVAPGFIDAHVHAYSGVSLGVPADEIGIMTGTTTMIDAGSAGPENIADFIEKNIKRSKTRIYSAMHYAKTGLLHMPEADDPEKYDLELVKEAYHKYKDYIVAIKGRASQSCVGQLGMESIAFGKKAANEIGVPYLVHIGNMPPKIEDVLNLMEKGDIITHAFHGKKNNLFTGGQIKPEAQAARERGVIFDVGHGEASFNFNVGALAKSLEFYPDIISTDLHARNYQGPVYSLSITLDKMMALGYSLIDCIDKATDKPARYFGLSKLGKLEVGCAGDFTIFTVNDGTYEFKDADGNLLTGSKAIDVKYAVIDGEIVMKRGDDEVSTGRSELMEKVRTELDISEEAFPKYQKDIEAVLEYLKEHEVVFGEDNLLAFAAHVVTLFVRLEKGEKVEGMGDEVLSQLDPKAVEITNGMMELVGKWYCPADSTETALVAIHIHTALDMMAEG